MELLRLEQGSEAWLKARLNAFTASEAPIMMGVSPHMSRDDLLTYKTTKIEEEVDYFTQLIYDKGHELEEMARPIAESILGAELYNVTGFVEIQGFAFLASFDGLTMLHDHGFEHKQWNAEKAAKMSETNEVLEEYVWQLEHQILVSQAEDILFVMSDGTEENMLAIRYRSVPERQKLLLEGWKQFAADLDGYTPKTYVPKPEGVTPGQLPSLDIRLIGEVKSSNLAIYEKSALAFIQAISTDLKTDEDFASAEKTIKFCDSAEKELELVKGQALSQTADISELFNTVDTLKNAMREKRLELNKLVKSRKEAIRKEIVLDRREQFAAHVQKLDSELVVVKLPTFSVDFADAIKGKKTIKSLNEAANDALSQAKVDATLIAQNYAENIETLNDLAGDEYKFLFNDLQSIVAKDADHFELLVQSRICEYQAEQQAKQDAEEARIREEERKRLEAAQEAKAESHPAAEQEAETQAEPRAETRKVVSSSAKTPSAEEVDIRNHLTDVLMLTPRDAVRVASALVGNEVPHVMLVEPAKKAA